MSLLALSAHRHVQRRESGTSGEKRVFLVTDYDNRASWGDDAIARGNDVSVTGSERGVPPFCVCVVQRWARLFCIARVKVFSLLVSFNGFFV